MGSECVSPISEAEVNPHVVIVSIPPPGHMLPSTELARELLSHGLQVTCFSTGRNFQSLHEKLEGKCKKGMGISFRALVKDSEFASPAGQVKDNLAYMQSLSDEAIAVRLEELMRTLTPPPCCIISDFLNGWSQDVANNFHIPRHVFFTMPANVLLFILSVWWHASSRIL